MSSSLFLWICFGFMWVMIFGVILYYVGLVQSNHISQTLKLGLVSIFSGSIYWLSIGYSISFFGNIRHSVFWGKLAVQEVPNVLIQLLFCLYAVVMIIGSILERERWFYMVVFIPLWLVVVYAPICYLFWGQQPWIAQAGVLDYSGGLVVHTTAGIGSFVLAKTLPVRQTKTMNRPLQASIAFIGLVFITFGWFGFNMAPSGQFGAEAISIWLNTLLSIMGGGISWWTVHYFFEKKSELFALMNGMIVGLVGSTCSVGYVEAGQAFFISLLVGTGCPVVIHWLHQHVELLDDAADSFGMNAIGGMIGSILTGVFAKNGHFFIQLAATIFVAAWSFCFCWLLHRMLRSKITDQVREKIDKTE